MSLLDAQGNPIKTPSEFSNEELIQILSGLRMRCDSTNAQVLQISMLIEYLYDQLAEKGIEIDLENFGDWSAKRWTDIQKAAAEQLKAAGEMDAAQELQTNINLEETLANTSEETFEEQLGFSINKENQETQE